MKLHSRIVYIVVLPLLILITFLGHSYLSFHSVNYSEIQRQINKNNDRYTRIPSSKPVIRIQTWNLKYDKFKDFEPIASSIAKMPKEVPDSSSIYPYSKYEESSWTYRRFGIVNDILFNDPDILCVQEAMKNQLDDLDEMLLYRWKWFGVSRDDGKSDGEHTAIFVKRSVFEIIGSETLWLSDTPYEISLYPGAILRRIVTIARVKHKVSGDRISILNTHWDPVSEDSRILAANMLRYIGSHELGVYDQVLFAGDLNSPATGKKSTLYKVLTGADTENIQLIPDAVFNEEFASSRLRDFKFVDFMELAAPQDRMGHLGTTTGFRKVGKASPVERIDFLMGGVLGDELENIDKLRFHVLRYKTGENFYDNDVQLSDHRPVIADVVFY